jgi:alkane 1-monooxygenase
MFYRRVLKYILAFVSPVITCISFDFSGAMAFIPVIYAFALIPSLELLIKPDHSNISETEEKQFENSKLFDVFLYLMVPIQFILLGKFLVVMNAATEYTATETGHILSMGLLCGIIGINVAHELGHRSSGFEKFLAKSLLLTSLYMHFFIEHNRGHHKRVATPNDPASARIGESLYAFWLRTIYSSYRSAWNLEKHKLAKSGQSFWSLQNEMIRFHIIQLVFVATIWYFFGTFVMLSFMLAALIGILLLETVNYIEHYGLSRQPNEKGSYEKVMHYHSWNSDHLLGRLLLFELSRHSDHHYKASKPYQLLNSWEESPQMPTGYPGMMLLTLIPPIWFSIMNRKIELLNQKFPVKLSK